MADVLINGNNRRIDDKDLTALVSQLGTLGYVAELDPSQGVEASRPTTDLWVLVLRWVGDDTLHVAFGAALTQFGSVVLRHFRSREKVPPRSIDLYGPDGYTVIASVDLEDEDPGERDHRPFWLNTWRVSGSGPAADHRCNRSMGTAIRRVSSATGERRPLRSHRHGRCATRSGRPSIDALCQQR